MMKLGTVIPYLKKIRKTYKSLDTLIENKISYLVTTADFKTKTSETENKIPHVTRLVKKTDFDTKLIMICVENNAMVHADNRKQDIIFC